MKKYSVIIEETVSGTFEIQASNAEAAIEIAKKQYNDGLLVLSPGEVQFKQVSILSPKNESTKWHSF